MPLVCFLLTAWLIWKLSDEIDGARAAVITLVIFLRMPATQIGAFAAVPDAPLMLCWTAALYTGHRMLKSRDARWPLLTGLAIGLALLSKYTAILFPVALLIFLGIDRRNILRKIDLSDLNVKGYVFQVALLRAARLAGARVRELPVDFIDRTAGLSKLQLSDVTEFMRYVTHQRAIESATAVRFAAVGASGIAVNLAAFTLLLGSGFDKYLAALPARSGRSRVLPPLVRPAPAPGGVCQLPGARSARRRGRCAGETAGADRGRVSGAKAMEGPAHPRLPHF